MAYVTAVTDRAQSDIDSKTTKGYFNVADWVRINSNSQLVGALVEAELLTNLGLVALADPTTSSAFTISQFNSLIENVEKIRNAVYVATSLSTIATAIKYDYVAGRFGTVFNFANVNYWEQVLDDIWVYYDGANVPVNAVLSADLTVLTATNEIYFDSITAGTYTIDVQGTGILQLVDS